ncbi:dihydrouridine synthase-domain-containing protein [Gautieria morchelliformis]|nr:dihydrouridine synthase-domain-containing protein [Gautieria morchelliformis]
MELQPSTSKLGGYDFYRQVLGSPRYVVAPMVDQSELPWRILARRYGAHLVYTPMINAKVHNNNIHVAYRDVNFNIPNMEEGGPADRPLIIQFCANDPDLLLQAAKLVESHCDAVDINFGCPQDIARRGRYGCFLQDDWDLVFRLINILHTNLSIPVTAKFRVFPSIQKTVEYAQMMERAGAQILTCHGRTREQRGVNSGLADWDTIRAVKQAVNVPVFANGNILYASDIPRCLAHTGADAIMSAEGHLYNAALFAALPSGPSHDPTSLPQGPASLVTQSDAADFPAHATECLAHPPHAELALEYLSIVRGLKTPTPLSAVKGHLFKIMRPALGIEKDLRDRLGRARGPGTLDEYHAICEDMRERMEKAAEAVNGLSLGDLVRVEEATGSTILPHWLAQPYFRPLPPSTRDKTKGVKDVTNAGPDANHDNDGVNTVKRPHSPSPTQVDTADEVKRTKR